MIIFCRRDYPISAAYMPYAIDRLMRFCTTYDTDTVPAELAEQAWRLYGAGDPRLGLWIGVEGGHVFGHLLAQPEPFDRPQGPWQYVLIRQAEVDQHVNAISAAKTCFKQCEAWARSFGVTRLVMLTHRNEESMTRKWGFQRYKVIMEKKI